MTVPTPAAQVAFLANLQRLLGEGSFVATYKLALLLALADLAVELGDDSGDPLDITTRSIAEKFITYYWRQSVPYPAASGKSGVLMQNTDKQAAIVRYVGEAHGTVGGSLARLRRSPADWNRLVSKVAANVEKMPLWKLQTLGRGEDHKLEFLYKNVGRGHSITLFPGVAFCLRQFHGLVEDLVRGVWVRFVREVKANHGLLGDRGSLDEFLFGTERDSLKQYGPILTDIQDGQCFYCGRRLAESAVVDHFVPWARYPIDLGHNFVLADATCNGSKADRLGAEVHLERWCERNVVHAKTLDAAFAKQNIVADRQASLKIAHWAYSRVAATNGLVWTKGKTLVPLGPGWRRAFAKVA